MSVLKGLMVLGGVIATGAALATAPIVTVSAPLWGIFGTTYTVNGLAVAGVAASAAGGAGLGKIAGQTGGALVIEGLDSGARYLLSKLRSSGD